VTKGEHDRLLEVLAELLAADEGLSEWQLEFIESLSKWNGLFTVKQGLKIDEVYTRWSERDYGD
jgi:hypothetical protein